MKGNTRRRSPDNLSEHERRIISGILSKYGIAGGKRITYYAFARKARAMLGSPNLFQKCRARLSKRSRSRRRRRNN